MHVYTVYQNTNLLFEYKYSLFSVVYSRLKTEYCNMFKYAKSKKINFENILVIFLFLHLRH